MNPPLRHKTLLVGWDSADWKIMRPLMADGTMPMMRQIVTTGISGNLATLQPMLSPLLWTSMATGKRAYDHGICGFTAVDETTQQVHAVTAADRRCKAIWNMLDESGQAAYVVGWFATHGERLAHGGVVSNHLTAPPPMARGTIWPPEMAKALEEFRVAPDEVDGEMIAMFVPQYEKVDQAKDARLRHLQAHVAESLTIQSATTWIMENRAWDFMAVYFRAIDEISHHFMPFHPPCVEGVPPGLVEIYGDVVNSCYRFHDVMLRRLVALAGPDTNVMVVSDHGFHSDHLRPKFVPKIPAGITVWHRPWGILAASGPGFASGGETLYGGSLLDISPTLLHLHGLPIGEDMEGKVLLQSFAGGGEIQRIGSWEQTGHEVKREGFEFTRQEDAALLEQFTALGYLDAGSGGSAELAENTRRENKWSLACAFMDGQRPGEALPLLEELVATSPSRTDFAQTLANCQLWLGLHAEANATLENTVATFSNQGDAALVRARIALQSGDGNLALEYLDGAREAHVGHGNFWKLLGRVNLHLRRWQAAEDAFLKALEVLLEDAGASLGLAVCHLRQKRSEMARSRALDALDLDFTLARAHYVLGVASWQLGDPDRAEQALCLAIRYNPVMAAAHYFLSRVYRLTGRAQASGDHFARHQFILRQLADHAQALKLSREAMPELAGTAAEKLHPSKIAVSLDIVIVSGLPRSGTSLMMQMLEAGGFPILTDHVRAADENNKRGYYEWEPIKTLPRNPAVIDQAGGRAVKVISALLPSLPIVHRYKIIWMSRPVEELARSQHVMRFGGVGEVDEKISGLLGRHMEAMLELMRSSPQVELLEVDFPSLVYAPGPEISRIARFLGPGRLTDIKAMESVIRPELHRQQR